MFRRGKKGSAEKRAPSWRRWRAQAVATDERMVEARDCSRMAHAKHTVSADVESRRRRSTESSGEYYNHLMIIKKFRGIFFSLCMHKARFKLVFFVYLICLFVCFGTSDFPNLYKLIQFLLEIYQ